MKILHLIGSSSGGGAERQLNMFIQHTYNKVKHIILIINSSEKDSENYPKEVEVIPCPPRKSKFDFFHQFIKAKVIAQNPDIFHNWIPATLPYSFRIANLKIPIFIAGVRSAYRMNSFARLTQALLYGRADRIVSNVFKEDMFFPYSNLFQLKKGKVIPNAIDFEKIVNTKTVNIFPEEDIIKILYVGRLIPDKNVFNLIKALTLLMKNQTKFTCVICGSGSEKESLVQFVRSHKLHQNVIFAGYRNDVYGIMKSADIFVLPSLREGMPNVAFEALAAGCQLAISDIAVHRRWFSDKSFCQFFSTDKPYEIEKAILKLNQNNFYKNKVDFFLEQFTIDNIANQYISYYQFLIKN